jgi:hypothetical protein
MIYFGYSKCRSIYAIVKRLTANHCITCKVMMYLFCRMLQETKAYLYVLGQENPLAEMKVSVNFVYFL